MAMAESWRSRVYRWGFNLFPAYWGTGAHIDYIASDWREIHVKVPLKLRTRNYVGTIFGGSMYGAVDPIYMIMLIRCLGSDFIVWDKAATIRFKKPGRTTLYARFALDDAELAAIRQEAESTRSLDRLYTVELRDAQGVVHATIEKTLYIRRKDAHRPVTANEAEAAPVG
jgi:hypothetical protein